ncbi:MAG TPA: methyltransferase [Polyangiaceae bacterium]|nr:methyltransferase [Polyangiaceae bacterium]
MTAVSLDCPKQARCSGCALGAAPYREGLNRKAQQLSRALAAYDSLAASVLPPRAASPTIAYRVRAKLVSHRRELGLFERGSHRVLDVAGCRVLSSALTQASEALRARLPLPIHGADFRETSEGVLLTLLSEDTGSRSELVQLATALVSEGVAHSVALALRRPGEVRLLASEPEVVAGPAAARHALAEEAPYAYAAHGGFVQAHAGQASYVYGEIARGLAERLGSLAGRPILELFAGNGSLALQLARAGARVTAVESYAPAIELSRRAAREQDLALEAVADDAARFASRAKARFDAILVNPPRRGLSPELREALARAEPRVLAYVSCQPRTLARDAAHLRRLGLELTQAEPLDMIPWSDAVEALTWFQAAVPPAPRVLFEDELCLAVEKSPHELLRSESDGATSLTARVRGLSGWSGAVPLEDWGAELSGVCWFARDAESASRLGPAHRAGTRTFTLLVRGNLRKQGTVTRRSPRQSTRGVRYTKVHDAARHSVVSAKSEDADERAVLADFASIRHPVLGDAVSGDSASNRFAWHRHALDRAFVHVGESSFGAEADGTLRQAQSPLAPDLEWVLESLGSD